MPAMSLQQALSLLQSILIQIVGWAILFLLAGMVMQKLGVRIPLLPSIDHVAMAYVAGAWWLFKSR